MLVKSRVVPNLCDLLLRNTRRYLKNVWRTLWRTFFLSMQWNSKGFKITLDHIDTISMDKNVLCSIAEIKSFMFGTTCGWVNDEFIFGWTIPLNCWHLKEALSPPWGLRLAITMFLHLCTCVEYVYGRRLFITEICLVSSHFIPFPCYLTGSFITLIFLHWRSNWKLLVFDPTMYHVE